MEIKKKKVKIICGDCGKEAVRSVPLICKKCSDERTEKLESESAFANIDNQIQYMEDVISRFGERLKYLKDFRKNFGGGKNG